MTHSLLKKHGQTPVPTLGYIVPGARNGSWMSFKGETPEDEGWVEHRSRDDAMRALGGVNQGLVNYGRNSYRVIERQM